MLTIEKIPPRYRSRPPAWYVSDWTRKTIWVYRTKGEAVAHGRRLDSNVLGHIVNVDFVADVSKPFYVTVSNTAKIIDCRSGSEVVAYTPYGWS